jgi:wyosine [tRNA(Phe)-imidazoG37] synthetase (radical SAM superfamily)
VLNNTAKVPSHLAAVRDHSRSFADFVHVYPVISRRSGGLSVGVNLNPDKVCNFDCVYCEVNRAWPGLAAGVDLERLQDELTAMARLVQSGQLAAQARFAEAPELARAIKDIAFSGDGEPTMVHNFADCARVVAEVRRTEGLTETKIVLITNAAGLDKSEVKRGLEVLDANNGEIWGKLDAGTPAYYRQVNRSSVPFERILRNLLATAQARPIVIQSLFFKLHQTLMPEAELAAYCDRLKEMLAQAAKLKQVQAYTIARPTPEPYATRLTLAELNTIASCIRERTGLPVLTFA